MTRLIRLFKFQQQIQFELEHQLEQWQSIVHAAPIGYLQVDDEDRLQWINPKACRLLKVDPQKQVQNRSRLLLEVVRSYELDSLVEEARRTQHLCQQDWMFLSVPPNLSEKSCSLPLRGYGLPLAAGHVGVWLEDRLEAATLAAERDRWTSDVAHELKTPLTSIRLVAETLQMQVAPELRTWIDRLLQEAMRLSALVQDVLELSQISLKQRSELRLKLIDLPTLVRSAWLTLEPLAQAKNLVLQYEGSESFSLQADEAKLYRVLINLLDNSIQYSPMEGMIKVCVQSLCSAAASKSYQIDLPTEAAWVGLDIFDMGLGFAPDTLPHIFTRFYRADPARARSSATFSSPASQAQRSVSVLSEAHLSSVNRTGGGSGLGLAIVQQIVTAH
ncbi:PAS domain-containing protein, partial [Synechococcales cyanobacterium C]